MATVPVINFSSSMLLSYYQGKLSAAQALSTAHAKTSATNTNAGSSSSKNSATAKDVLPWNQKAPTEEVKDAQVLQALTFSDPHYNFIDQSKVPLLAGQTPDSKMEQDNQKLFSLYNAVNQLAYLTSMSARDDTTAGQMAGYNKRLQQGLAQVTDFIKKETFNGFSLQAAAASSSVVAQTSVPSATFGYTGGLKVADDKLDEAIAGLSTSQQFTVAVTKDGATNNVAIDLSQVSGPLTIDNVVTYINQQLQASGSTSRFQRVMTDGTISDVSKASWGIAISSGSGETVSLSAPAAAPAIYLAGTAGLTAPSGDIAADNQGRLVKLTADGSQNGFTATTAPSNGTSTATATAVDANGNVYMLGNATGDFDSQLHQGSQDVYLSKYDSAGNLQWTQLLGSSGSASGMSLAVNPTGGVVVAGSTNADLTTTAIAQGNVDSFVTRFDSYGSQVWTTQLQTLNQNQATAVSVDAQGNVYLGGQTTGAIAGGQTANGGSDAYIAKLDTKGKVVYEQQLGTSGNDSVAATAITATGDLMVASVQNGQAVLSKYTGGDATQPPAWQINLGTLGDGGSISGLAVSGGKIYVSGTSANGALNANVKNPSSGGNDAFVIGATDNATSATADFVSYVGTATQEKGGAVAVGPDGTVYLTGTTKGTLPGQNRSVDDTTNMFVTAMSANGDPQWTHQYGGAEGQSSGQGIAIDPLGASVLDTLGLARGTIPTSQSHDLTTATTLRPGDSFKVAIQGTGARTFTVKIEQGETLRSLVRKINIEFGRTGTASINYGKDGAALQIKVAAGVTAKLLGGPGDFDALSRLGIAPCTLSADPNAGSKSSTATSSSSSPTKTFGLGLTTNLDISTAAGASHAKTQLSAVLNSIRYAYQQMNNPAPSTTATTNASQLSVTAANQARSQISGYNLALSILGGSTTNITS
jgi:hypothetical protein